MKKVSFKCLYPHYRYFEEGKSYPLDLRDPMTGTSVQEWIWLNPHHWEVDHGPFLFVKGGWEPRIFRVRDLSGDLIQVQNRMYIEWGGAIQCSGEEFLEQLISESIQRFGEVKVGDIFLDQWEKVNKIEKWIPEKFKYSADIDMFYIYGICVYSQGQWRKKVS
ncbi:hypothetical protein [Mongoliibacter ruber]|uniref:Uncharacterized protein n=1 Tax=Mongoliibacter ruber TaxID=1750599 RepID=A0A2T0WV59_9BACT|nr:hypothetical protein [Mongoliibacter ruber]PRY90559.1 hypothetical protein CLW00_101221 [Mongoliibacter ruber]